MKTGWRIGEIEQNSGVSPSQLDISFSALLYFFFTKYCKNQEHFIPETTQYFENECLMRNLELTIRGDRRSIGITVCITVRKIDSAIVVTSLPVLPCDRINRFQEITHCYTFFSPILTLYMYLLLGMNKYVRLVLHNR